MNESDDVVYLGSSSDEGETASSPARSCAAQPAAATGALAVLMNNAVVKPVLQWMGSTKRGRAGDSAVPSNRQKKSRGSAASNGSGPARGGPSRGSGSGDRPAAKRSCPWYKKLEGTPFWVDAFHHGNASLCQHYILTHFHSDHYGGLSRRWDSGTIYCNAITAALVRQQLGVHAKYIREVPMNTPVQLCGCTVTVLDANHCPGATLWLLQTPAGKTHLHVGDFRWHPKMKWLPSLRRFAAGSGAAPRLDTLYLDTTYCDSQYTFPPQAAVVRAVVNECRRLAHDPRVLFLFGSYTIGKERLFMAVAEALDERIFVSPAKWRVMQCCGWSPQQMARFTTLESAARIHVVPMGALSVDRLEARWRSLQAQAVEGGNAKKQGALKLAPKPAPRKGRGKLSRFLHRASQPLQGGGSDKTPPPDSHAEEDIADELGLGAGDGAAAAPKPRLYGTYHSILAFKPTGWTFTQGAGGGAAAAEAPAAAEEARIMGAVGAADTVFSQGTLQLLGEQLAAAAAAPGMLSHLSPSKEGGDAADKRGGTLAGRHAMRGVAELRKGCTARLPTGLAGGSVQASVSMRGGGAKARHPAWFLGGSAQRAGGHDTQCTQLAAPDAGMALTQTAVASTPATQGGEGGASPRPEGTSSRQRGNRHDTSAAGKAGAFRGGVTLYGVPYSEHSSFAELRECVRWLAPRRIVPTVNAAKAQEMVALLLQA